MTGEKIFPNPGHPGPAANPCNLIGMPANQPSRVKRRVRSITPPDTEGFATTSHLNVSEPVCRYRELLDAAYDHLRPKSAYAAALSAQNAPALRGMRRVDECLAPAVFKSLTPTASRSRISKTTSRNSSTPATLATPVPSIRRINSAITDLQMPRLDGADLLWLPVPGAAQDTASRSSSRS